MLFNSYFFIFLFLPVTFSVYFFLNKFKFTIGARLWLAITSLFFYGYWNINYIPLILGSIIFNYFIGKRLGEFNRIETNKKTSKESLLVFAIVVNLLLLGYYKYTNFFIENINLISGSDFTLQHIILPLGISFFTFTQIAFLVDNYKGLAKEYDFLRYLLFVTYFPHLIAGPIIHHREMMPQFGRLRNGFINHENIGRGLYIFAIGLFKKLVIADTLSVWANNGFDVINTVSFFSAWATTLSYTFQLYFDFSGYCDMAIGTALLFNIWLPFNFDSPYKSFNIQEFWHKWHVTLSSFLREYIYIPLGGNRKYEIRTYVNLGITFIIGGIWHGAGYTFIIWGLLHGLAISFNRFWQKANLKMPPFFSWPITFFFVMIAWVFFRADSLQKAQTVLRGMISIDTFKMSNFMSDITSLGGPASGFAEVIFRGTILISAIIISFGFCNSKALLYKYKPCFSKSIITGLLIGICFLFINDTTTFLYFNF